MRNYATISARVAFSRYKREILLSLFYLLQTYTTIYNSKKDIDVTVKISSFDTSLIPE